MQARRASLLACLALLAVACSNPPPKPPETTPTRRSLSVRDAFIRANPCPVTGSSARAPCPGWQIDHIVPLCAGGPDELSYLRWLRTEEHARKTTEDRRTCRRSR